MVRIRCHPACGGVGEGAPQGQPIRSSVSFRGVCRVTSHQLHCASAGCYVCHPAYASALGAATAVLSGSSAKALVANLWLASTPLSDPGANPGSGNTPSPPPRDPGLGSDNFLSVSRGPASLSHAQHDVVTPQPSNPRHDAAKPRPPPVNSRPARARSLAQLTTPPSLPPCSSHAFSAPHPSLTPGPAPPLNA